jgi:alpha-acetolactate decarboxylase
VYAEVEEWETFQIENITTKSDLEEKIFEIAKSQGINTEKPFPFLLEGNVAALDWHVINWKKGDTIHNHKKHKESGLNGTLRNTDVEIVGFYSTKHKAIFTHHTTNIHVHFKTNDNSVAGHIDDIQLENQLILKLSK